MNPMNISDANNYATAATLTGERDATTSPTFPAQTTGTRRTGVTGRRRPTGPDSWGFWGSRKVFV
jgi:hypothetical protein